MYSGSRGILYTAPPGSNETDENRAEDAANSPVDEAAPSAANGATADD